MPTKGKLARLKEKDFLSCNLPYCLSGKDCTEHSTICSEDGCNSEELGIETEEDRSCHIICFQAKYHISQTASCRYEETEAAV